MAKSALLGHTGFLGSTLSRQEDFSHFFSSRNIDQLTGHFDKIYCSAAPGKKWIANKDPKSDWVSIQRLIAALRRVTTDQFVLVSTVDVFAEPWRVDETTDPHRQDASPYGLHRLRLEEEVRNIFENPLVVRLPGLVGPGLRKNALFDLHHNNNLDAVDSRSVFQFYPVVNLKWDIAVGLEHSLSLLHLTAQPTAMKDIASLGFGRIFKNEISDAFPTYDFRTIHASLFLSTGNYQYSAASVLTAVRGYHQTEPKRSAGETK